VYPTIELGSLIPDSEASSEDLPTLEDLLDRASKARTAPIHQSLEDSHWNPQYTEEPRSLIPETPRSVSAGPSIKDPTKAHRAYPGVVPTSYYTRNWHQQALTHWAYPAVAFTQHASSHSHRAYPAATFTHPAATFTHPTVAFTQYSSSHRAYPTVAFTQHSSSHSHRAYPTATFTHPTVAFTQHSSSHSHRAYPTVALSQYSSTYSTPKGQECYTDLSRATC
jgi:hypothetical protein